MEPKTIREKKKNTLHSYRLLIAIAFRYHHYEHFYSQIDVNKLTIVNGKPGNSVNNNCDHFLDVAPLKMYLTCCSNAVKCFFSSVSL